MGTATSTIVIASGVQYVDRWYLAGTWLAPELPEGDYVFLEVIDDGPGMSADTLAKIFDPFFTTKFTGRGLGLAAVLGIVRGHGGAIKVVSAHDQGTTFTILFPAALAGQDDSSAQDRLETGESPALFGSATTDAVDTRLMLVIDDEESVRLVTARMLERLGYRVITAADGRAGIDLFRNHADTIATVLLDLTMPHPDGEQTLRAIQAINPDARVVIMSGYDQHSLSERFAELNPAGFLQKPFRPGALQNMITQVLAPQE